MEQCPRGDWHALENLAEQPSNSAQPLEPHAEGLALLIEAITEVANELQPLARDQLADRVMRLGGYAAAGADDWARSQTAKARFATSLAARLIGR